MPVAVGLQRRGLSVVLVEYRGWGSSRVPPTEEGLTLDAIAVVDHLVAAGVAPDRVVLLGVSLGSAVAGAVVARRPVGRLVLVTPVPGAGQLLGRFFPWLPPATLVEEHFDALSQQPPAQPTLVVHGTADRVTPLAFGRALAASLPDARLLTVAGGGHSDLFVGRGAEAVVDAIAAHARGEAVDGAVAVAAEDAVDFGSGLLALVAAALFLDLFLYSMVVPVLPAQAQALGASPSAVGALFGAYALALLVVTPGAGALVDRVGDRRVFLAGLLGLAVTTALFATSTSYAGLVASRALQGAAAAACWTAGLALVVRRTPAARLGRAVGLVATASSLGILLGPPLTGLAIDAVGPRVPFFATGGVAVGLFALCFVAIAREDGRRPQPATSALWRSPALRRAAVVVVGGAAAIGMLEPTLPQDLAARLSAGPAETGLLFGVTTLAYGLCAPVAGALCDRVGGAQVMRGGALGVLVSLPLLTVPQTLATQGACMVLVGASLSVLLTPTLREIAAVAARVGGHGAAAAVYNVAYALGLVVGAFGGGPLVSALGVARGLVAAAVTVTVVVFVALAVSVDAEASTAP